MLDAGKAVYSQLDHFYHQKSKTITPGLITTLIGQINNAQGHTDHPLNIEECYFAMGTELVSSNWLVDKINAHFKPPKKPKSR